MLKGAVTVLPEAADKVTDTCIKPPDSPTEYVDVPKFTVGAASSSVVVTVVEVTDPSVALVGEPRLNKIVSSFSSSVSCTTVTAMFLLVSPGAKVTELPVTL